MKIAQRFSAGMYATPEQVPKTAERWRERVHVQPFLRDSNPSDVLPGVETPGYSRDVPPEQLFAIRSGNFRKAFS